MPSARYTLYTCFADRLALSSPAIRIHASFNSATLSADSDVPAIGGQQQHGDGGAGLLLGLGFAKAFLSARRSEAKSSKGSSATKKKHMPKAWQVATVFCALAVLVIWDRHRTLTGYLLEEQRRHYGFRQPRKAVEAPPVLEEVEAMVFERERQGLEKTIDGLKREVALMRKLSQFDILKKPSVFENDNDERRKKPLESWRVLTECDAYDLRCPLRLRFDAYPLKEPAGVLPYSSWATKKQGTDLAAAMRSADRRSRRARWWRRVTASDAAATTEATRRGFDVAALRSTTTLDESLEKATASLTLVTWTMTDERYAAEMLDDVVAMAATYLPQAPMVVVCLDRPTARACVASGYRCAVVPLAKAKEEENPRKEKDLVKEEYTFPQKKKEDPLRSLVQNAKFEASRWFVDHGVSFIFFEMDVWFVQAATALPTARELLRGESPPTDIAVAAHQNNPTATNIGVYAVEANVRTRLFFKNLVDEAAHVPDKHDQLVFHNVLSWHRLARAGKEPPKRDNWKDMPSVPLPETPVTFAFIPPHVGVCSITPVPTEDTVFVHTLGTSPLQEAHGKRLHAKELGVWFTNRRRRDVEFAEKTKSSEQHHEEKQHQRKKRKRKYLAYDGHPLNALSICEKEGYHSANYVKARLTFLVGLARATNRILILPKIIADYYVVYAWTFLDLASLDEGLCEWRETNFATRRDNWFNDTHPFSSVAQVSFKKNGLVGVALDGRTTWLAHDHDLQEQHTTTAEEEQDAAAEFFKQKGHHWDLWASVLETLDDRELLLVNDDFLEGDFVRLIVNCDDEDHCATQHSKAAGLFHTVFRRLRWCGDTINLKKHASISFQGFDCYGQGTSFDDVREEQRQKKKLQQDVDREKRRKRPQRRLEKEAHSTVVQ
mmetsp:Transcript_34201/g.109827  ORF Transcript_34201/g.109827 Transcript_34201/m.109827 type:complete len:890 (+) Transcript_34201:619-3288(+)